MFQAAILNILEKNVKMAQQSNRKSHQRNRKYRLPNGTSRIDKCNHGNKNSLDGLTSRMEETEERISELGDGVIEIT